MTGRRDLDGAERAVAGLRMRDDLLQAMYWLRGEGLAAMPDLATLLRFVGVGRDELAPQVEALLADGLVARHGDRYELTESGVAEGGRRFADEFRDLTRSAHGDCPPDCPHCEDLPRDECSHCQSIELGGEWASA